MKRPRNIRGVLPCNNQWSGKIHAPCFNKAVVPTLNKSRFYYNVLSYHLDEYTRTGRTFFLSIIMSFLLTKL